MATTAEANDSSYKLWPWNNMFESNNQGSCVQINSTAGSQLRAGFAQQV
jgi:hypothetical protein